MRLRNHPLPLRAVLVASLLLVSRPGLPAGDEIPEVIRTLLEEAEHARDAGKLDAAVAKFEEARRLAPDFVRTSLELGSMLYEAKRIDDALAAFRAGLEANPEDPALLQNTAAVLLGKGDAAGALPLVDRAISKRPGEAAFHSLRAQMLRKLGRPSDALAEIDEALAAKKDDPKLHFTRGNLLHELGRKEEAIGSFRAAIERDRKYLTAWYNLGAVLFELSKYDDALEAYRVALEPIEKLFAAKMPVEPVHARAYQNLGAILLRKGDRPGALDAYRKAAGLDPKSAAAAYGIGAIEADLGRKREAEESLRRAIELDPSLATARLRLGLLLIERKDWPGATKELETALPKLEAAERRTALLSLARARQSAGDVAGAEQWYRAEIADQENDEDALVPLSRLLRGGGRLDDAASLLEGPSRAHPESIALALERAAIARRRGDGPAEEGIYRRLLAEKNPPVAARLGLLSLDLRAGRLADVRKALDELSPKAGKLSPEIMRFLDTLRALLAAREGRGTEAAKSLAALAKADPGDTAVALDLAALSLLAGSGAASADSLAKLERDGRTDVAGLAAGLRGLSLWSSGKLLEAKAPLETALLANPKWGAVRVALGEIELAAGRLDAAIERLELGDACTESTLLPASPDGAVLLALGGTKGEGLCRRAAKALGSALASRSLELLGEPGRAKDARRSADRALTLPLEAVDRALASFVRGSAELLSGGSAEAAKGDLAKAAGAAELPEVLRPYARTNLGIALERSGSPEAARREFEAARNLKGAPAAAALNFGISLDSDPAKRKDAVAQYESYLSRGGAKSADVRDWIEEIRKEAP